MSKTDIKKYGLIKKIKNEHLTDKQKVGRIISRNNENYRIITECGILAAEVSNKLKYEAKSLSDYPVVGDFVIVEIENNLYNSTIIEISERKNSLIRKGEWDVNYDHIVASNIDTVFVCLSLNNDFNIQKLKAYISIALNCNAESVIILSECDSFSNIDNLLNEVRKYTSGMEVIITSDMDSDSYKSVKNFIKEGKTAVFIGPEHDKSKIVNKILGEVHFEDELVLIKGGGIIINTPEMRELGIESENITKKFVDTLY
jgi:ribosome biogenesis GTPase